MNQKQNLKSNLETPSELRSWNDLSKTEQDHLEKQFTKIINLTSDLLDFFLENYDELITDKNFVLGKCKRMKKANLCDYCWFSKAHKCLFFDKWKIKFEDFQTMDKEEIKKLINNLNSKGEQDGNS